MNVLHAGIFVDHELGGDVVFEKGLLRNQCNVERFDYRTLLAQYGKDRMHSMLLDRVTGKDLLFVGKGESFNADIFGRVRKRGVAIALWYGDVRPNPERWLLELLPEVDFFFMSSGGDVLREHHVRGGPALSAYYFNPADPELSGKYGHLVTETRDILFTGTSYGFVGPERRRTVEYLVSRGDATFFGGAEQVIRKPWLGYIAGRLRRSSPRLRGHEYIAALRSAKIGVGVSAFQQIEKYTSDRMSHYLTFGSFYLPWKYPGIEKFFEYGKELVWFDGIADLAAKLDRYLAEPDERRSIAAVAQAKMLRDYSTENVAGMMLDVIYRGSSDRFPWIEIIK